VMRTKADTRAIIRQAAATNKIVNQWRLWPQEHYNLR
jgi:hypothetical protein